MRVPSLYGSTEGTDTLRGVLKDDPDAQGQEHPISSSTDKSNVITLSVLEVLLFQIFLELGVELHALQINSKELELKALELDTF